MRDERATTVDVVIVLRCTARWLARRPSPREPAPPRSTTRLGDGYANLLVVRPAQLVLCVSACTLLPVLVPAKPFATLSMRLAPALDAVLRALDVPAVAREAELRAMDTVTVAQTANRRVVGTMVDFARMLEAYDDAPGALLERALDLARSPCSVLAMESPAGVTRALFGVAPPTPLRR